VPNKAWLLLAWIWTIVVAVLCLVRLTNLPKVGIESPDKYVHAVFHFIFVLLWCQHFRKNRRLREIPLLAKALLFSIAFGCLIEIAQEYFTASRQADLQDVLANFVGAAVAVIAQLAITKLIERKPE
jgi:VanZ family protein